jgi:hypothetical protein
MCGIRGQEQHAVARPRARRLEGHRRRARRLADAPLAAEKREAHRLRHRGRGRPPGRRALERPGHARDSSGGARFGRRCALQFGSDGGKRAGAPRLFAPRGQRRQTDASRAGGSQRRDQRTHGTLLDGAAGGTPAARPVRHRRQAIEDECMERNARVAQSTNRVRCLFDRHRLGQGDPDHPGSRLVAKQRRELLPVPVHAGHQRIGGVGGPATPQGRDHHTMLFLHVLEDSRHPPQNGRRSEHAQRMPGGRRIDHDALVSAKASEARDFEERGDFVDAGEGESQQARDVLFVEPCAAQRNLLEPRTAPAEPTVQRGARVDLDGVQASGRCRDRERRGA